MRINGKWTVRDYDELAPHFENQVIAPAEYLAGIEPFFFAGHSGDEQALRRYFFPLGYDLPEMRLDLIRGAFGCGAGFVFTPDGSAAHACAHGINNQASFHAPWANLQLSQVDGEDFSTRRLESFVQLESAYFIAGSAIGNYHHLLSDIIPRLDALANEETRAFIRSCGADPDAIPIIINHWAPYVADHIQELGLGIRRERIIPIPHNGAVWAGLMFIPPFFNDFRGWASPKLIEFYAKRMSHLRVSSSENIFGKRLFHLRRDVVNDRRAIRNADTIANFLKSRGFEELTPASMSLRDEMMAFSQADCIVGAMGSNLSNTVFSRPGTRILSIQSDASLFCLTAAVGAAGHHEVGYAFGRSFPESGHGEQVQFEVDLELVEEALNKMLDT